MPHWKALPEKLDPHIREFASQLRLIVERGGLNITALADRTGFDEASWERYLSGRNLPPRRAVVALADATGTPQHHLTAMWELAERVHSFDAYGSGPHRSDPYDSDAYGSDPYGSDPHRTEPHGSEPHRADGRAPFVPSQRGTLPPVPQQRQGGRQADAQRGGGVSGRATGGRSNAITLAVGAAAAVIVIVGALMLAPSGDEPAEAAPQTPTAAPTSEAPTSEAPTEEPAPEQPAGVECRGADCAGQNPDEMGCGGDHARTVSTAQVGAARVEVRYSEVCSAAWARLTEAGTGDTVTITGGADAAAQNGAVTVTEAYTPMVAVKKAADAKACATLTAGTKGCTT
ncbi:helix-turn-helix domain-containing protein [Streptomyces cyaneofuscatus]|uniref:helix-turn-helix domain-containing protein n=1 Tax=Streptomyces cyaneofuscatus TaxID=66883 RepID=UPI0033B9AF90